LLILVEVWKEKVCPLKESLGLHSNLRHFGGRRLLDVGFWYEEGPMNKLLLSTNQIARIL
jgi:hypothetical protein